MRLLPDTHALIWWLTDDPRLSDRVKALLQDEHNPLYFSAAAEWEIGIKRALGKLTVPDDYDSLLDEMGTTMLSIENAHAARAAALPPHHRDPFDRLLVAQAQIEEAVLLTADPAMRAYDVRIEW